MNAIERHDDERLDWNKMDGLLPAIVQDADSGRVLTLAYMSRESLAMTLDSGLVTFFSRSRQSLWRKGDTSGNRLRLVAISTDCDGDALLVSTRPTGPACHLGRDSCFEPSETPTPFFVELERIIAGRAEARPRESYTATLLDAGPARVAQKVGEEGVELALAAVGDSDQKVLEEGADLLYHLLVLLRARGLGLDRLDATLRARHQSGS